MISDAELEALLRGDERIRPRRRRRRARLLLRAYWRDALCIVVGALAIAWIALDATHVRFGWLQ